MMPNLFLVGAMKAGTTSVAELLARHPEVYCSPIKEPNFFCRELHDRNIGKKSPNLRHFDLERYLRDVPLRQRHFAYIESLNHYRQLFAGAGPQTYRLDASTTYLASPVAAAEIARVSPDARIIAITRNPAARAWSEFVMNVSIGVTDWNYRQALKREAAILEANEVPLFERYVSAGLYHKHIPRYQETFGMENVLVLDFEALTRDEAGQIMRLHDFLGIEPTEMALPHVNKQNIPNFIKLNKFLHHTGLKNLSGTILPKRVLTRLRKIFYRSETQPPPMEFIEKFNEIYSRFA